MSVDPDNIAPDDSHYDPWLRLWTDPHPGERTRLVWAGRASGGRVVEQWAEPVSRAALS